MLQYQYRVKAKKSRGALWVVQVLKASHPEVPIATWVRSEGLYLTMTPETLIFEEERRAVKGCGIMWEYEAYARKVPGNWRFWSEEHAGTSALLRPALARATGTAMRTTGGQLVKLGA